MEIVKIRITSTVVTAPYGTIMPGTILRTDAEYARFLVESCQAGEYVKTPANDENKQEEQQVTDPKRARKSKGIQQ